MTSLTEEKLETIDWTDSNRIFVFSVGTVKIAKDYQLARKRFAIALKTLKIGLARAYASREISPTIKEDKAYLIIANDQPEIREALMNKIESEHEYKGLEKILDTRQSVISLAQSLIKNRLNST